MVKSQVETITPERAATLLSTSCRNRPLSKQWIQQLVRMIQERRFVVTGQGIVIDSNGHLIDGHHRLTACVQAGIAIRCLIVDGVSPDAFANIDRGRVRTYADIAALAGHSNPKDTSSAAVFLFSWQHGTLSPGSAASATAVHAGWCSEILLEMLNENPDLMVGSQTACRLHSAIGITRAVGTGMFYVLRSSDTTLASEFFESLITGASLKERDPRLALRNLTMGWRIRGKRPRPWEFALAIAKAWNMLLNNEDCYLIRTNGTYSMPKLEMVPNELQFGALAPKEA